MHQPTYRKRFAAAYGALGLVVVASAFATWFVATAAPAPSCSGLEPTRDPIVTTISFIQNAVEREDPGAAYGLVTPSLRRGLTCAQWANATPVASFEEVDWSTASYKLTAGGTGQLVYSVTLAPQAHFLVELREHDKRWLVGFWERVAHAPSAP